MSNQFEALHAAMRAQVDQQFLPGVSTALLRGREVVDVFCYGHADIEAGIPLREDHIFRAFSSTKLITSCAALLLLEEGRFQLDDPLAHYLPELANLRVMRPGATRVDDTEPQQSPITIRQLMTHTAGFAYGIFDPGTPLFKAYNQAGMLDPGTDLATMVQTLAGLPLASQPGTRWEYSVAADVLGRLVEVVSGERFGAFLSRRILGPLGMTDTDFVVPPAKQDRFCALYAGTNMLDGRVPGLKRLAKPPFGISYLEPVPREGGGGGLVTTLGDSVRLMQSLMPSLGADGSTLLKPDTFALMASNHLAGHMQLQFPGLPPLPGRGFGLGSAVCTGPGPYDPADITGETYWGGLAGTLWWINPRLNIAGVLMTQRYMGFADPFTLVFKQQAYKALGY